MKTLNFRSFVRQLATMTGLVIFMTLMAQAQFTTYKPVIAKSTKFEKAKLIALPKEDCLSFNYKTIRIQRYKGTQYRILDGNHAMFLFPNYGEALKAYRIIKKYKMNSTCFVGRPGPSFKYLKVAGKSPKGSFAGEDCIGFDPNKIKVVCIKGRWKIVQGSHWIFDFNKSEKEARQSYAIIKRYGFTKSCYVGRPNPSFQYLRR